MLVNAKWKSFEEMEKHMHPVTRSRIAQLRPKARACWACGHARWHHASHVPAWCWLAAATALPPRLPHAPGIHPPARSSTAWMPAPWPRRLAWAAA